MRTAENTAMVHFWIFISVWVWLWMTAGFLLYGSTGHDDSHITFWSANTLLTDGQILNYNGEALLQSSSLLMTLLTAAISFITGIDVVICGYAIAIAAGTVCCLILGYLVRRHMPFSSALSVVLLTSCCSFLLWAFSGMESTLAALCLLCVVLSWQQWIDRTESCTRSQAIIMLFSTATLISVRPEMPLVTILLALWAWLLNTRSRLRAQHCLQLLLSTLALAALLLLWQKYHFENWLPQPVSAKQGTTFTHKIWQGYVYTAYNIFLNPLPAIALLLAALVWRKFRRDETTLPTLLTGTTLIYFAFIIAVGGDWMQAGRFFVPILPVTALLLTLALAQLPWHRFAHGLALLLCLWQVNMQYRGGLAQLSHGIPVWAQYRLAPEHERYSIFEELNQEHLRDMAVIDHLHEIIPLLRQHLQRPVRLMSGQAGMVFYYTAQRFGSDVRFTDLRGLIEDSLTQCAALRDLPRGAQGLFWNYRDFFERSEQLQSQCGIDMPDIIYDINDMSQKLGKTLEPFGYVMIHKETGFVVENTTRLNYNRLLSPNMIFIRQDLISLLPQQERRIVDYTQLPLKKRY